MAANKNQTKLGQEIISRLKEFTESLENGKCITEKYTHKGYRLELQPQCYSPDVIKQIRETLQVSQGIFASFIGVSTSLVQAWELGDRVPSGAASRIVDEIIKNPPYWKKQLHESIQVTS